MRISTFTAVEDVSTSLSDISSELKGLGVNERQKLREATRHVSEVSLTLCCTLM